MKRDLAQTANAAIVLGDVFVPPPGAKIRFRAQDTGPVTVMGNSKSDRTLVMTIKPPRSAPGLPDIGGMLVGVSSPEEMAFEVVSVPRRAPPFADWLRL